MGEMALKLPDVGEGVDEAELVEWHVKIGDLVREDTLLAAVMTDKATVEIPSPVDGEILWLGAEIGDLVPVGSDLVRLKVSDEKIISSADATRPAAQKTAVRETAPSAPPTKRSAAEPAEEVPVAAVARAAMQRPTQTEPIRHLAHVALRAE